MSSDIYMHFDHAVTKPEWKAFCERCDILYSPRTMGGRTFYHVDRAKIAPGAKFFGESLGDYGAIRTEIAVGKDADRVRAGEGPPDDFLDLRASTAYGGDLDVVSSLVHRIAADFPCRITCSPEFDHLLVELPRRFTVGRDFEDDEILPTDFLPAWKHSSDGYSATVSAGAALVRPDEGIWRLSVDGIDRATARDLDGIFAYAGRCDWSFWGGVTPEAPRPESRGVTFG